MRENLYIRIGSQDSDPIQWLITAEGETDEIASGELANKDRLSELTEKAKSRTVKVIINGADVRLHSLTVPGKSERAIKAAAPYMLEDDLADDVEKLFFAFASKPKNHLGDENCFCAVIAHQQIDIWLTWFNDADIIVKAMLPDFLALPLIEDNWTTLAINQQILIRSEVWQGFVVNDTISELVFKQLLTDQEEPQQLTTYSPIEVDEDLFTIAAMPEELPLLLLAKGYETQPFNLLQGEYLVKEQRSPEITNWLWVAGVAVIALLLNLTGKVVELNQLNSKYEQVSENIKTDYKKAFPQTKRVRLTTVRRQINSKLAEFGAATTDSGLLAMLEKVQPAFAQVPKLKPESLRFDAKRKELRLAVTASDYQSFEQFKQLLEQAALTVETGAQNNQGDVVTGSFNIRSKS
ncbi:type II secretion system protein GspL [Thalassotalea psychrophila]|uniref:Type II secretion system protein L n=1 Tax=Thalassotalea psychrophila TaxID=3065647 RepID=A0ABY9TYQ8_9GAMM|nr:type II secretion system protein GspL [Colwelliaceae bacterium SQ149]